MATMTVIATSIIINYYSHHYHHHHQLSHLILGNEKVLVKEISRYKVVAVNYFEKFEVE